MNKTSRLKSSITLNDLNLVPLLSTSVIKSMLQVCVKCFGTSSASLTLVGKRFLTLRLSGSFSSLYILCSRLWLTTTPWFLKR